MVVIWKIQHSVSQRYELLENSVSNRYTAEEHNHNKYSSCCWILLQNVQEMNSCMILIISHS